MFITYGFGGGGHRWFSLRSRGCFGLWLASSHALPNIAILDRLHYEVDDLLALGDGLLSLRGRPTAALGEVALEDQALLVLGRDRPGCVVEAQRRRARLVADAAVGGEHQRRVARVLLELQRRDLVDGGVVLVDVAA